MSEWRTTFHWEDNNGHEAQSRIHYSGGLSLPAVVSRAEALASAMHALSSARVARIAYTKLYDFAGATGPQSDSDVEANLLLFYGNDTGAATLRVPSPRPLSTDLVGPYRAVRLVLAAPEVSPLLASLGGNLASVLTPGGAPWPLPVLAGGFTRYRGPG